ncbi:MAG: hypothetical protein KAJ49_02905, partial [Arcobacteraceae bacterium]|nr:hypothetical protein [Arcobacteraceae bacterium]
SVDSSVKISGTILGLPSNKKWASVFLVDPINGYNIYKNLEKASDGNCTFSTNDIDADGNYTMEVSYEDENGKWFNYFVKKDGVNYTVVEHQEVSWEDLGNGYWGPSSSDVSYMTFTSGDIVDIDFTTLAVATTIDVQFTLENIDKANVYGEMFIPGQSVNRWIDCSWDTVRCTQNEADTIIVFDDIKPKDGYYVKFGVDGQEYYYNNPESILKASVNWTETDGVWSPDTTAYNLNNETEDQNITVSTPSLPKISGTLNLGLTVANSTVYMNIWQHNGNSWAWAEIELDSNGEGNFSIEVSSGSDYRVELYSDNLGGFVVTNDSQVLISNQNSWKTDGTWGPLDITLIDVTDDNPLGILTLPTMNLVTFKVENLDGNVSGNAPTEDIFISVESDTEGYFGDGNAKWSSIAVTYSDRVTISVPTATDYKIVIFPNAHKHGNAHDANTDGIYDVFNWDSPVLININEDVNFTIKLPLAADLKSISGTVNLGNDDIEAGWIEAWSDTQNAGLGTVVDANGSFIIKGLEAADDYEVKYSSWESNDVLKAKDINVSNENYIGLILTKSIVVYDINGTITGASADAEVFLLIATGSSYEIIKVSEIDESGNYNFNSLPELLSGEQYVVAVSTLVDKDIIKVNALVNPRDKNGAIVTLTGVDEDGSITNTVNQ